MTHTLAPHDLASVERLESRVVLAATEVAIVGLTYDQAPYGEFEAPTPKIYRTYTMEGSVSDDNLLSYRTRWSGAGGAGPASPLQTSLLHLRDDGSFDYANARWPTTLREQGPQFLPDDGYAAGWWHAREFQDVYIGGFAHEFTTHAEDQLIVPLAPLTSLRAVEGSWEFSIHQRDLATGRDVVIRGSLNINATSRSMAFHPSGGGFPSVHSKILGYTGGTRFRNDNGQSFFLSADRSTLIFADLDSSDGTVHIGVAVLSRPIVAPDEVAGTYFITSNQGFDRSYASRLQINADGTYTQEFIPAPRSATVRAPEVGNWQIGYDREITLRPSDWTPEHRYALSRSGGTLLQIANASGATIFSMGRKAILAAQRSDPVAITSSLSDEGRHLVFIDRSPPGNPWTSPTPPAGRSPKARSSRGSTAPVASLAPPRTPRAASPSTARIPTNHGRTQCSASRSAPAPYWWASSPARPGPAAA